MLSRETVVDKRTFIALWILCIIGSWSVLPYVFHLNIIPPSVSVIQIFLLSTVQSTVLFGLACWLSYLLLLKTDLSPFNAENLFKRIIYPGMVSGVLVGLIIYILDNTIFKSSLLSGVHPLFWTGALASIYGAVNEEVLLRLFLFTFVYFLFGKILSITHKNRLLFLWTTNILVAIVFGLGHLPAAFKLSTPSSFETFRVLLLNGIPGVVFGWLYWSRGLFSAMAAHFVTDLMIHVLLI